MADVIGANKREPNQNLAKPSPVKVRNLEVIEKKAE
jgi:hypothetical protein